MLDIARAIGFHGKVKGLDTSKARHSEKQHDRCNYVEYRPAPGGQKCEIYYKKMDKMTQAAPAPYVPGVEIQWTAGNRLRDPNKSEYIPGVSVNRTPSNKGQIHHASFYGIHSFEIP